MKDWKAKQEIEEVLREHPSYGHKRLAKHLGWNKKRVLRIMKLYVLRPRRRKTKPWRKASGSKDYIYPNLLLTEAPTSPGDIWASDFTHIAKVENKWVYLATVIDLFTREIVGWSVMTTHSAQLVMNTFLHAIHSHSPPRIIHSDQGSEYTSDDYTSLVEDRGILMSMSHPGCPWENGYQESFYGTLKVEFGDPGRFASLGELVAGLHEAIYYYNNNRIHTAFMMPPREFAEKHNSLYDEENSQKVS